MNHKECMTRAVLGSMTNGAGVLFGGELLSWMDELSGIAAKRYAKSDVVTAGIQDISFLKPIPLGAFIDLEAQVQRVGNTSMEISLEAWMDSKEDGGRPGQTLVSKAHFIYVSVDENGKPQKVVKQ